MDYNSKDFTYANLLIIRIKRMLGSYEKPHKDFSDSEIVYLALGILRIMTEIPFGKGNDETYDWDLFFKAQKSRDDFIYFLDYLKRTSFGKNQTLNDAIEKLETEDIEEFIKKEKGGL